MPIDSAPVSETPWARPQEDYPRTTNIEQTPWKVSTFDQYGKDDTDLDVLMEILRGTIEALRKSVGKILSSPWTKIKQIQGYVGEVFEDLLQTKW